MDYKFATENEINKKFNGASIKNALIKSIDLTVNGHFGNVVLLDMPIVHSGNMYCNPFYGISSTLSCGIYIRTIFELLDIYEDNGIKISEIKDKPCRAVIFNNEMVAIGNFMNDKFIIIDDLLNEFKKYIENFKK